MKKTAEADACRTEINKIKGYGSGAYAENNAPDRKYMELAMELALRGCGKADPNPLVGAVIVKNGEVIGKGYHTKYGCMHAEREALADCRSSPAGAAMYVTLEPCCHHGKQPPCTDAVIDAGISHVVVGSADPNPLVSGKGVEILKAHGINVTENFMRKECDALNPAFFKFIRTGMPYVVMKYAMTMDGKIATRTGASKWITSEAARKRVHEDRNRCMAIMAGIGTVLSDNPLLNCRIPGGRNPVRVICDTHLRIPETSRIVQTAGEYRTLIATAQTDEGGGMQNSGVPAGKGRGRSYAEKCSFLTAKGCELLYIPIKDGHLNLEELMRKLGEMDISSVMLEGGGTLNWSALEAGIVDRLQVYMAPKIFGGKDAPSPVGGMGAELPSDAFTAGKPKVTFLGDDILIESELRR